MVVVFLELQHHALSKVSGGRVAEVRRLLDVRQLTIPHCIQHGMQCLLAHDEAAVRRHRHKVSSDFFLRRETPVHEMEDVSEEALIPGDPHGPGGAAETFEHAGVRVDVALGCRVGHQSDEEGGVTSLQSCDHLFGILENQGFEGRKEVRDKLDYARLQSQRIS